MVCSKGFTVLRWLVVVALYFVIASKSMSAPGALSSFNPGGQYIMFTFSSGPHFKSTPVILDILKAKRVKATFFINGFKSTHYTEIVSRIHNEGHELANGGFHQTPFTSFKTTSAVDVNVRKTNEIITNVTKAPVQFCRPPKGLTNANINQQIQSTVKAKVVLWSLDSEDLIHTSAKTVFSKVAPKAKPGDIVLFHDTQQVTVDALPGIIDQLYKDGYEFLTLSQVQSFPDDSPH